MMKKYSQLWFEYKFECGMIYHRFDSYRIVYPDGKVRKFSFKKDTDPWHPGY